jgi:ATP-dependent DNA ligase
VPDALIEPGWSGVRVLSRFESGNTRLMDEEGVDCSTEFADVAAAITAAVLAGQLILDGFLTVEPTQIVTGAPPREIEAPTSGQMMAQWIVGSRIARPVTPPRNLDPNRPIAFVAVDLLQIDGSSLLDVPLLERKRLLDGSLEPSGLVRITPYVRPPIGSFVATWRGAGFASMVYKAANSRYRPDARNDDWSVFSIPFR